MFYVDWSLTPCWQKCCACCTERLNRALRLHFQLDFKFSSWKSSMSSAYFQPVLLFGLASYFLAASTPSVNLLWQLPLGGKIFVRFWYGYCHGQGTVFPQTERRRYLASEANIALAVTLVFPAFLRLRMCARQSESSKITRGLWSLFNLVLRWTWSGEPK